MKKLFTSIIVLCFFVNLTRAQCTLTLTPSSDTVCMGQCTVISVSGAHTYEWLPGNMTDSIVTLCPASLTTYTVTGTDQSSATCSASITISVKPMPNITVQADPMAICAGGSSQLTAYGGTGYIWHPAGLTGSPVTVYPATTTTYTVSGSSGGCTGTASVTVIVHPDPIITISPAHPVICLGSCITLTPQSSIPGSTYTWVPGLITGPSITVCPAVSTTYTVTVSTPAGCTGTNSVTVIVGSGFTFDVVPHDTTILSGQCVPLNISTQGNFTWAPSVGLNTTGGPNVIACPPVTTTYTVMGWDMTGCTGSAEVTVHIRDKYIQDVSGSTSCHMPYLAILDIFDDFVMHSDTILYHLNFGDGSDTIFSMIYQNNPTPVASVTHIYDVTGIYSPWAVLQHNGGQSDTIHAPGLIIAADSCGDISGRVFNDVNHNCVADSGEFLIPNALIKLYDLTHALILAQFTDGNGFYGFNVPNGNYTVEADSSIFTYCTLFCPSGGSYSIAGIPATDKNFGADFTGGFDLYGFLTGTAFRPNFVSYLFLTAGNNHYVPSNANVKLILDPLTTYNSAYPVPSSVSGDTITWLINNLSLAGNAFNNITVCVMTSSLAVIGDTVSFDLSVTPVAGDSDPLNNSFHKDFIVTNSYDPNEKDVSPAGDVIKNTALTYTIHFQNTGTAEAYNIYILDTLDQDLDLSTLKLIAASHPYSAEIIHANGKNILKFLFPDIMLPDSGSNQMLSNGFITYQISPLGNSPLGTIINNTAGIYFDFNPEVTTNTTLTTIVAPSGIQAIDPGNGIAVYPNPSAGMVNITVTGIGKDTKVEVFNSFGQLILSKNLLNQSSATLDLSNHAKGMYVIKVQSGNGVIVEKVVISE